MRKFCVVFVLNCIGLSLLAQPPQTFRYQGRVLQNGALVSGSLNITFKLYDTLNGGSALYTDSGLVTVADGLYSTLIGDDASSSGDLADALGNPEVYLEITIEGETLSPRERIVSVPYAMNDIPAGSIILSETAPNAALEARGYTLLISDPASLDDWQSLPVYDAPPIMGNYPEVAAFGSYFAFWDDMHAPAIMFYTTNGVSWESSEFPFQPVETAVLNDILYIFGADMMTNRLRVARTSNGSDWQELTMNDSVSDISGDMYGWEIEVFDNKFFLFGVDSSQNPIIAYSMNGVDWTVTSAPWPGGPEYLDDSGVGSGRLVVSASDSAATEYYLWSTTDGVSWTKSSAVPGESTYSPDVTIYNDSIWIVDYSLSGFQLYKSDDWGQTWNLVPANFPAGIDGFYGIGIDHLGESSGLLLSEGNSIGEPDIYLSTDGIHWGQIPLTILETVSSSSGKIWLLHNASTDSTIPDFKVSTIGGPFKSGRFFYYQKN